MGKGLATIVVGLVAFLVVQVIVSNLITGTGTGDTILTVIVPLAVIVVVTIIAVKQFMRGR